MNPLKRAHFTHNEIINPKRRCIQHDFGDSLLLLPTELMAIIQSYLRENEILMVGKASKNQYLRFKTRQIKQWDQGALKANDKLPIRCILNYFGPDTTKLKRLNLPQFMAVDKPLIIKHFPNLEHLSIKMGGAQDLSSYFDKLKKLTSLGIGFRGYVYPLKSVIQYEKFPSIQKLSLSGSFSKTSLWKFFEGMKEWSSIQSLDLSEAHDVTHLYFPMRSIHTIKLAHCATLILNLVKSKKQYPSIKTLDLTGHQGEIDRQLLNCFPNLTTLILVGVKCQFHNFQAKIESKQPFFKNGTVIYPDGVQFIGEFYGTSLFGRKGELASPKGNKNIGNFVNNRLQGKGKCINANGGSYEGNFEKGNRHGIGKSIFANGAIFKGNYEFNRPKGEGFLTYPDQETLEGEFFTRKGIPGTFCRGIHTTFDGQKLEGLFHTTSGLKPVQASEPMDL